MNAQFTLLRLATSLALVALTGSAAAAQAATEGEITQDGRNVSAGSSAKSGSEQNKHCVIRLSPVAEGQKESASNHIGCFSTFAAATYAGTNGAVSLPPDATPKALKESDLASSAYTLIGVDYEHSGYHGRSYSWYATNSYGCRYGYYRYRTNMPSSFNDILSSTYSTNYGECHYNTNFQHSGYWGRYKWCYDYCSYIGDWMNDRTSSKTWARNNPYFP